jgi:hypothetical protein
MTMRDIPNEVKYPGWLLLLYLVYSQAIPAFRYEWGIRMGTQDAPEVVTRVGTAFWYGFCVGDLMVYIPCLALGLLRFKSAVLARVALIVALGITAYWPVVCLTAVLDARNSHTPGWNLDNLRDYYVVLSILEVWTIWSLVRIAAVLDDRPDAHQSQISQSAPLIQER